MLILLANFLNADQDLTPQFKSVRRYQWSNYGNCHVYAAATLLEEACYRKTGKKVQISRAHLYYLHLQRELTARRYAELFSPQKENAGYTTGLDPGSVMNHLDPKIPKCSENNAAFLFEFRNAIDEFVRSERAGFISSMNSIANSWKGTEERIGRPNFVDRAYAKWVGSKAFMTKEEQQQFYYDSLTRSAPERLAKSVGPELSPCFAEISAEEPSQAEERDLKACLALHLEAKSEPFSTAKAKALIDKKIPFACAPSLKNGEKVYSPHVAVVAGYKSNPQFPGGLEYNVIDSNVLDNWGWELQCKEIYYFP